MPDPPRPCFPVHCAPSSGSPPPHHHAATRHSRPHRSCCQFNAVALCRLPDHGPSQPNSKLQLFVFARYRVACKPDRVEACQARSLQHTTTRRVGDQQPASEPDRRTDGRTDIQPGRDLSPVFLVSRAPYNGLNSYSHPHPHPHHYYKVINHVTCTGSCYYSTKLVAAGAVAPLQISHRPQIRFFQCLTCPQLLRFVRPPAQQTDDETSPHWHRTVVCSGAPSEASGAAE